MSSSRPFLTVVARSSRTLRRTDYDANVAPEMLQTVVPDYPGFIEENGLAIKFRMGEREWTRPRHSGPAAPQQPGPNHLGSLLSD